jgi:hypothetical protein
MKLLSFCLLALLAFTYSCKQSDPLPSWNDTSIKKSILQFISNDVKSIPVEDRIAVFDMDGTIACETPLWFEMYAAVNGLNQQSAKNPDLLKYPEYQYAQKLAVNPFDTSVTNHWVSSQGNYIDSMVWKAYAGVDHEAYVDSARQYLTKTKDPKYGMPLAKMFYQPMVELIQLLKDNQFKVYVVSGSMQGVIWSVCPQTIGLERMNLIGTRQIQVPSYNPAQKHTSFIIQKGIFPPKDDNNGKSLNIYSHIGKVPVFAFGNTNGDFGMFHLTATSKYPHVEYLLNHDDSTREYAYPPYHGTPVPNWQDSLKANGWKQVNMKEEFKTVWIK